MKLDELQLEHAFNNPSNLQSKSKETPSKLQNGHSTFFSKSVGFNTSNVRLDSHPDSLPLKLFANQAFGIRERPTKPLFVKMPNVQHTTVPLKPQTFYTPEPETGLEGFFSNQIRLSDERKPPRGWF
jgi:hypothetical protein